MSTLKELNNNIKIEEKMRWDVVKKITWIVVIGFVIHGTYAFDKTIWFDDAASLNGWYPWAAIEHGRWAWGIIDYVMKFLVGTELIASWHIMNSFIIIALIALVLLRRFDISNKAEQWILIVYMLVNVSVLGNIAYVGSSAMNFFGLLITTISAIVVFDSDNHKKVIIGILLLVLSLGMYQCYLAYFVTLALILFIKDVLSSDEKELYSYLKTGLKIIGIIIISLGIYFVVTNIVCKVSNHPLTDYAGTASYGIVDLNTYLQRVIYAYRQFFLQSKGYYYSLFPFEWGGWWIIFLVLLITIQVLIVLTLFRKRQYKKCFTFVILNILLPLAHNLIFVMYNPINASSLHVYQSILIFFYAIILLNFMEMKKEYLYIMRASLLIIIAVIDMLLIKYDNQCYVSIKLEREQSISFMNRLLAEIHSTEGYVDGMEIFVVDLEKLAEMGEDKTAFSEGISTNPYDVTTFDYTKNDFVYIYNGEKVNIRDLYEGDYEYVGIYDMPKYPSYGSIKVIDDRVIVNL